MDSEKTPSEPIYAHIVPGRLGNDQTSGAPLAESLDAYSMHHGRLDEILNYLESRLSPILKPGGLATQSSVATEQAAKSNNSPLVDSINSYNGSMAGYVRRVENILDRLEI